MNKKQIEEYRRITKVIDNISYRCKCGHAVVVAENNKNGFSICSHCGRKVTKDSSRNIPQEKRLYTLKKYWEKRKANEEKNQVANT